MLVSDCAGRLELRLTFATTLWLVFCLCGTVPIRILGGEIAIQFNRDIRPILSDKCFACHGADAGARQADLRLDTEEGLRQSGASGVIVLPGQANSSLLIQRITATDVDQRMPPSEFHKELTRHEVDLLTRWIDAGAVYQRHWSFEPPRWTDPPQTVMQGVYNQPLADTGSSTDSRLLANNQVPNNSNAIDAFILDKLASLNLTHSPSADKPVLIRRVSFALTGLPPTTDELNSYINDHSEAAYDRMVDYYLQSPRFGEEMARHWLDVARYADTHGMHLDNERQTWAYRDWVVSAFNGNLPFDQFTVEQLAGDLLPNATQDQLVATGFSRCNVTSSEGGSIPEELIYRYAVDRASTTISAWLGLTGGCAVCHDHKFDPISQREFYSFYAFFNSAADPAMDGNALLTQPTIKLESDVDRQRFARLLEQQHEVLARIEQVAASLEYADPAQADPQPKPILTESLWMDDQFPNDGKLTVVGAATQLISSTETLPAASGRKMLKRTAKGTAQDVWESGPAALLVPDQAKFVAQVWIDPQNKPRSIMLQFNRDGWNHRAVWGDYAAIDWGQAGTTERVHLGELPEAGKWIQLELPADLVGLNAGDKLVGFALTQHDGTVYWDKVGVQGLVDRAADSRYSLAQWTQQLLLADPTKVPMELRVAVEQLKRSATEGLEENPNDVAQLRAFYLSKVCQETTADFAELHQKLERVAAERAAVEQAIPSTFVFRDMQESRQSFVMMRGAYNRPADQVQPGVLAALPPLRLPNDQQVATRLDLARWLVAPEQPLTARVIVNRFWQQIFGIGLVKTSYDFGSQGEPPTHPELLDWLALYYQQQGWDTKKLLRLMLTSTTFQQSSKVNAELLSADPENRNYARGPRFRLDAEQIRDNALFVSGLLDLAMGGPGVKPYQPPNIWEPVGFAGSNTRFYKQDEGVALYRRSLYTFFKRTAPPPFLVNFDAPNREQSCMRRERSNTPLQALQLMNDVQYVEAARNLAQRAIEREKDLSEQLRYAYAWVLSRSPRETEMSILEKQYSYQLKRFTEDLPAADQLLTTGQSSLPQQFDQAALASLTMVCNTLLNLDETITRN